MYILYWNVWSITLTNTLFRKPFEQPGSPARWWASSACAAAAPSLGVLTLCIFVFIGNGWIWRGEGHRWCWGIWWIRFGRGLKLINSSLVLSLTKRHVQRGPTCCEGACSLGGAMGLYVSQWHSTRKWGTWCK